MTTRGLHVAVLANQDDLHYEQVFGTIGELVAFIRQLVEFGNEHFGAQMRFYPSVTEINASGPPTFQERREATDQALAEIAAMIGIDTSCNQMSSSENRPG